MPGASIAEVRAEEPGCETACGHIEESSSYYGACLGEGIAYLAVCCL